MPEVPQWIRIIDILFGLIAIIIGALLFLVPGFVILYGIGVIVGIGLIILGLWQLVKIFMAKELETKDRVFPLFIGIIMLIFGILFVVSLYFFATLLVYIFGGAILVIGLLILIQGVMGKELKQWIRILYILIGLIAVVLAVVAFLYPMLGMDFISIVISVGLIFFGTLRLLVGITGDYN